MGANREYTESFTEHLVELDEPPMFRVILLNDDYTTMEFVVMILMAVFHKSEAESQQIMISVHQHGRGVCGVYVYEVAETKVKTVEYMATEAKFPLRCIIEEA